MCYDQNINVPNNHARSVGVFVLVTPGKCCAETTLSGVMYFW